MAETGHYFFNEKSKEKKSILSFLPYTYIMMMFPPIFLFSCCQKKIVWIHEYLHTIFFSFITFSWRVSHPNAHYMDDWRHQHHQYHTILPFLGMSWCHTRQHFHSSYPTQQPFQSISFILLNISISLVQSVIGKKW